MTATEFTTAAKLCLSFALPSVVSAIIGPYCCYNVSFLIKVIVYNQLGAYSLILFVQGNVGLRRPNRREDWCMPLAAAPHSHHPHTITLTTIGLVSIHSFFYCKYRICVIVCCQRRNDRCFLRIG